MEKHKILSNSTLKIIAVITMFIDHLSLVLVNGMIPKSKIIVNGAVITNNLLSNIQLYGRDVLGRFSFPLFCFLLVEGFIHTSNRKKYLIRLGIFALISEIPYDLVMNNKLFYLGQNNVFFTLFIGLATLMLLEKYQKRELAKVVIILSSMLIAFITMVSYGALGIILILLIHLAREKKEYLIVVGAAIFLLSPQFGIFAFCAFLLMLLYNGKKGLSLKYLFYIFYPLHLILLYLFRLFLIK